MSILLLIILVVVWLIDRSQWRRDLESLRAQVDRLQGDLERGPRGRSADPGPVTAGTAVASATVPAEVAHEEPAPAVAGERDDDAVSAAPAPDVFAALRELREPHATSLLPPLPTPQPSALLTAARRWADGGHLIARLGVVILFFGVAFLLRYAAEHSHLPIEVRLAGVAAGAGVLLALGWRWRVRRPGYALALQGGGVGVLYLTVFAAYRLYDLLPPGVAFALLAAVAATSAALAVLQDSLAFALLGTGGGFLAPLLVAAPQGSPVSLFGYYAVLDLAVLTIAWFRSWRALNLVAFFFTYVIGTLWGVLQYRPELLTSVEPFVALFFLMFVGVTVLFAWRSAASPSRAVDAALAFGVPSATFGVQAALVHGMDYAMAFSALALGLFYVALGRLLWHRGPAAVRFLVETFLALAVACGTLAIPLALDGRWSAAAWALEGAGVLWVGLRLERRAAVAAGVLLQLGAGLLFARDLAELGGRLGEPALQFHVALCAYLVSAGGLVAGAVARLPRTAWYEPFRATLAAALYVWGFLWWLGAGAFEIDHRLAAGPAGQALLAYVGLTAVLSSLLGARLAWVTARRAALFAVPALALLALDHALRTHPFADGGVVAWPFAFLGAAFALRRDESQVGSGLRAALHVLALWLFAALAAAETAWQVHERLAAGRAWTEAMWGLVPSLVALAAVRLSLGRRWPCGPNGAAYAGPGARGLGVVLALWSLSASLDSDGAAAPLPYLPFVNPMDIAQAAVLLAIAYAGHAGPVDRVRRALPALLAAGTFLWVNTVLLRTLHHFASIPYASGPLFSSTLVQTSLTILWSVLALVTMASATRFRQRPAWLAGAALLAAVVLKLFAVDLSSSSAPLRIVSFLGVGILMLVLGYVAPLPPSSAESS